MLLKDLSVLQSHVKKWVLLLLHLFFAFAPWPCWQVKLHWLITQLVCVGITVVHPAWGPWEQHAVSFCQQLGLLEYFTFCVIMFMCVVLYFTLHRSVPKSTTQLPPSSFLSLENQLPPLSFLCPGKRTALVLMSLGWTMSPASFLTGTHLNHHLNSKPTFCRPHNNLHPTKSSLTEWCLTSDTLSSVLKTPWLHASLPLTLENSQEMLYCAGVWTSATWSTKPPFHCKSRIKNSFNTQRYAVMWQWWELYCTLMVPACADRWLEPSCSGAGAPSTSSLQMKQTVILSNRPYSSPVHH